MGIARKISRVVLILLAGGGIIYFPLIAHGGDAMPIQPGFAGGLPFLLMADRAVIYIDGTPLSYDLPTGVPDYEWQGYRLDATGDYNYFVAHFVVPPWMPASVHIRPILRVYNIGSNPYWATQTTCHYGGVEEESDQHSVATSSNWGITTPHSDPSNVAPAALAVSGLTPGDIMTCEFIIYNDVGPTDHAIWFVGFEVYP